jgi:hypothetical protein
MAAAAEFPKGFCTTAGPLDEIGRDWSAGLVLDAHSLPTDAAAACGKAPCVNIGRLAHRA